MGTAIDGHLRKELIWKREARALHAGLIVQRVEHRREIRDHILPMNRHRRLMRVMLPTRHHEQRLRGKNSLPERVHAGEVAVAEAAVDGEVDQQVDRLRRLVDTGRILLDQKLTESLT